MKKNKEQNVLRKLKNCQYRKNIKDCDEYKLEHS